MHLSYSEISVDKSDNPSVVVVYVKRSKTDSFCKGTSITLGATHDALYPVKAIMPYLARQGSQAGPLFICENNHYLTFRSYLKKLLQDLNLDPSYYNTHSFRIRAATSAEAAGLTESQIKILYVDGEVMHTAATSNQCIPS